MKRSIAFAFAVVLALAAAPALADSPTAAPTATPSAAVADAAAADRARDWIGRLQTGTIDRAQLTDKMNAGLTNDVVASLAAQLGPLGDPTSLKQTQKQEQNGVTVYVYALDFARASMDFVFAIEDSTGHIAGLRFTKAS